MAITNSNKARDFSTGVTSTSAQLALLLALYTYGAVFGKLKHEDLFSNSAVDLGKVTLFINRFKAILSKLLISGSHKDLLGDFFQSNPVDETINHHVNLSRRTYIPAMGKLKYFDNQQKIKLSKRGDSQLQQLFSDLEDELTKTSEKQAIHGMNESNPQKSAPLSPRRIALLTSCLNTLDSVFAYEAIFVGEDDMLLDQHVNLAPTIENLSSLIIGMLFSVGPIIETLTHDKKNRTYDFILHARTATVQALLAIKKQQDIESKTEGTDDNTTPPTEYHNDEKKPLLTPSHQTIKTLTSLGFPSNFEQAFNELNTKWSIDELKGTISAESARNRSYYSQIGSLATGALAVIVTSVFLFTDIFTGGASLAIRIGLCVATCSIMTAIRYSKKKEHAKRRIYAKYHRDSLNQTFQRQLRSELTIYGLQPAANPNGSAPILSSTTIGVKRQVEVDVENFLGRLPIIDKDENSHKKIMSQQEVQEFLRDKDQKYALKVLAAHIRKHLPEEYRAQPTYFIKECLFQLRVTYFRENAEIVQAEREACFAKLASAFTVKAEKRNIKKLNQYMLAHEYQTGNEHKLEKNQVLTHLDQDLRWNPRIALMKNFSAQKNKEQEIKNELSHTFKYKHYAAKKVYTSLREDNKDIITANYRYAATLLSGLPSKGNEKVLNAYYVKRYEKARVELFAKSQPKESRFHYSSSTLFNELKNVEQDVKNSIDNLKIEIKNNQLIIQDKKESEPEFFYTIDPNQDTLKAVSAYALSKYNSPSTYFVKEFVRQVNNTYLSKDEVPTRSFKQEYDDNMAGVLLSCALTSATTGLMFIFPFISHIHCIATLLSAPLSYLAAQSGAYFCSSSLFRYTAIQHRRYEKQESKLRLAAP